MGSPLALEGQEPLRDAEIGAAEISEPFPVQWSSQLSHHRGPLSEPELNVAGAIATQSFDSTEQSLKQYCTLPRDVQTWDEFSPVRQPDDGAAFPESNVGQVRAKFVVSSDEMPRHQFDTPARQQLENEIKRLKKELATMHRQPATPAEASVYPAIHHETRHENNSRIGLQTLQLAHHADSRGTPLLARKYAMQALKEFASAANPAGMPASGEQSFYAALTALRESTDFGRYGDLNTVALQRLVNSHQTPALKETDLAPLSLVQAGQAYHDLAERYLVRALRSQPIASQALALLAKTEPFAIQDAQWAVAGNQACLLKAALTCDPYDVDARESLGNALIKLGLFEQAKLIVEASAVRNPTPELLRLMGVINRRLGYAEAAASFETQYANQQSARAKKGVVIQMNPHQFAQLSPQQIPGTSPSVMNASYRKYQPTAQPLSAASLRNPNSNLPNEPKSWSARTIRRIATPIRSLLP